MNWTRSICRAIQPWDRLCARKRLESQLSFLRRRRWLPWRRCRCKRDIQQFREFLVPNLCLHLCDLCLGQFLFDFWPPSASSSFLYARRVICVVDRSPNRGSFLWRLTTDRSSNQGSSLWRPFLLCFWCSLLHLVWSQAGARRCLKPWRCLPPPV